MTIIALLLSTTLCRAAETKIKLKDAPAPVQATVNEQTKGAKLKRLVKNGAVYEAELTVNGRKKDVSMDATGAVSEVEEEVALKELPAAAKAAVEKAAEGGKILAVEAVSYGGPIAVYEAEIKKAGKKIQVRVDPSGNPAPK